jgi:hypothetical protein
MARNAAGEAGLIIVDATGRSGSAHSAAAMEVATFDPKSGAHYMLAPRIAPSD